MKHKFLYTIRAGLDFEVREFLRLIVVVWESQFPCIHYPFILIIKITSADRQKYGRYDWEGGQRTN